MTRALVFGLGSAHGDDQIAWLVAERLAAANLPSNVTIRRGTAPSELLDVLNGFGGLILCDACLSGAAPGTISCWHWPHIPLAWLRPAGSHDLRLAEVLKLAEQLRLLPPEVTVYAVEIESASPTASISTTARAAVGPLVAEITALLWRWSAAHIV